MKKTLFLWLAIPFVAFSIQSCSSDDELVVSENEETPVVWARPAYKLTVSKEDAANLAKSPHRVVLLDSATLKPAGKGVSSKWLTSDKVGVWNITAYNDKGQNGYNTVSPLQNDQYSEFGGNVNCSQNDMISLFYPYSEDNVTTSPEGIVTFDLRTQEGTLEAIAAKYDIMYGQANVDTIFQDTNEAAANLGNLTHGVTLFTFSFKDEAGEVYEIDKMRIKVEGAGNQGILDINTQTLTVGGTDTIFVEMAEPQTKVYVAMPGNVAGKRFKFDIVDKYGFSHKASAKAPGSLKVSQITRATLNSKDGDYIEMEGIKWAKGNFLWDNGEIISGDNNYFIRASTLPMENYFIAPSQEWSPGQLNSTSVNMPVWPGTAPSPSSGKDAIFTVPNPTARDGYYETFYLCSAGKHGEQTARGRQVNPGANPTGGTLYAVTYATSSNGFNYQKRLWRTREMNDGDTITLEKALNGEGNPIQTGLYFGDLPYLVSRGQWAMPTFDDLQTLFEHPNAVWGVYFVTLGPNMTMRVGVTKTGDATQAPIYGIYISKEKPTTDTHELYHGEEQVTALIYNKKQIGWKGEGFVLNAQDLKKGIFLPADGLREQTAAAGTLNYKNSYQPGEFCSYICSNFGAGGFGAKNARHWQAEADNDNNNFGNGGGRIRASYSNLTRTTTGSIRPVFVGDVFE